MAKIRIPGVKKGHSNYTIHLELTETQQVEGQSVEVPIGEAFVSVPPDMELEDIQDRLVDVAQQIMDAHKDAANKRADIQDLDFPDIT